MFFITLEVIGFTPEKAKRTPPTSPYACSVYKARPNCSPRIGVCAADGALWLRIPNSAGVKEADATRGLHIENFLVRYGEEEARPGG
jgi:hypothetical protein